MSSNRRTGGLLARELLYLLRGSEVYGLFRILRGLPAHADPR